MLRNQNRKKKQKKVFSSSTIESLLARTESGTVETCSMTLIQVGNNERDSDTKNIITPSQSSSWSTLDRASRDRSAR